MGPSNKSEVKITTSHCYNCDIVFGTGDEKKTDHHVIPKSMKPTRNIVIPVCAKCHKEIHQATMLTPKLTEMDNFLKGMKQS